MAPASQQPAAAPSRKTWPEDVEAELLRAACASPQGGFGLPPPAAARPSRRPCPSRSTRSGTQFMLRSPVPLLAAIHIDNGGLNQMQKTAEKWRPVAAHLLAKCSLSFTPTECLKKFQALQNKFGEVSAALRQQYALLTSTGSAVELTDEARAAGQVRARHRAAAGGGRRPHSVGCRCLHSSPLSAATLSPSIYSPPCPLPAALRRWGRPSGRCTRCTWTCSRPTPRCSLAGAPSAFRSPRRRRSSTGWRAPRAAAAQACSTTVWVRARGRALRIAGAGVCAAARWRYECMPPLVDSCRVCTACHKCRLSAA